MSLQASVGYVIVELLPNNNVTDGGIHLPDGAVCVSNRGVVISDGGDELVGDTEYETGDVVHFPLHLCHRLVYQGKDYLALLLENVLAVELDD